MLNSYVSIGRVLLDARMDTDGVARFALAHDHPGLPDSPTVVPYRLSGEKASMLAPYLHAGTLIGVRGQLRSGLNESIYVEVQELNFLHRPQPERK